MLPPNSKLCSISSSDEEDQFLAPNDQQQPIEVDEDVLPFDGSSPDQFFESFLDVDLLAVLSSEEDEFFGSGTNAGLRQ